MDLDLIARTSAILICAGVVATLLRRAASSTRHLVWHIAIAAVVIAPYLTAIIPAVPILPMVVPQFGPAKAGSSQEITMGPSKGLTAGSSQETPLGSSLETVSLTNVAETGRVVVAGWFLLCWILSGVSVWRGSKAAPEAWVNEARFIGRRLGLKRDVPVRRLNREASPHVAGFFRSVVMMPPSAATWTPEARQAALVHELTHVKRADRRTQAIAQIASAIYWFNPLVWYASAALARERERACDDEVLRFGAKPSAYATLLLDIARTSGSAWTPATALSMARPSAIEGRLLSILADVARTPRPATRWIAGAATVTLATAILGAQAAQPGTPSPTTTNSKPQPLIKPLVVMGLDDQSADPSVTGALVDALSDRDGQVREHAAMGLAIIPGAEVIEPLISALKDPDSQVREKAAIGLAFRRDPKIVEPLLTAIEDSDSQVREKAAIALGASGDSRAIGALTKATKDPDSQVREKAVAGLVLLGLRK